MDTYCMTLIQLLESRKKALTVHEIAELLGVSEKHIYEMTADGTLPAFYVGRSVRLDPQDIADWLRKKRPIPTKRSAEGHSPKASGSQSESKWGHQSCLPGFAE
jgi:excisionase family DNA binding protein